MIVPADISPIDYLKYSNEYIFVTAEFTLRVNYVFRYFELETPEKNSYHEDFEFLKSPPEWFETIDFGIVEWIRIAVNWNDNKPLPPDERKSFFFEIEGARYEGWFNPSTNAISLIVPGKTIVCRRDSLTTDFPDVQFMEKGELITKVTDIIIDKIKSGQPPENADQTFELPLVFNPTTIIVGFRMYDFDYNVDLDLALLIIPERQIQANLLLIETDAPELTEMHDGMLCDIIRSVVYEKSHSD